MQDNFNIHSWRLTQAIKEMDEATFTSKHDDNPKLKGGQKKLPDELQAGILKKEASLNTELDNRLGKINHLLDLLDNLKSNTATNSTIPTTSKQGLLFAFQELIDVAEDLFVDIERDYEEN